MTQDLFHRIGPETEHIFTSSFWSSLDLVCNALDNLPARLYVDRRCVWHGLPLVDSGTLGTKANVQVMAPHATESYGASADPAEKQLPMCTLKFYPFQPAHTLQWARDAFERLFATLPAAAVAFGARDSAGENREEEAALAEFFFPFPGRQVGESGDDCVAWARLLWERFFANDPKQLLHHFPPNATTADGSQPFWSPPKRCPTPLVFDSHDEDTRNFIASAARLQAEVLSISLDSDEAITSRANAIPVPEFSPDKATVIPADESEMASHNSANNDNAEDVANAIRALYFDFHQVNPLDFEKDDDSNGHMRFVRAASNLRSRCYGIEPVDAATAKLVAGRIVPALATTTSAVAGLAAVEICKVVAAGSFNKAEMDLDRLPRFKNSFVNLALPLLAFSDPMPAAKMSQGGWTEWDKLEVAGGGERTIGEVIECLRVEHNVPSVFLLALGTAILYADYAAEDRKSERLAQTCPQALEAITGQALPGHVTEMEVIVSAEDKDGNEMEVPAMRLTL